MLLAACRAYIPILFFTYEKETWTMRFTMEVLPKYLYGSLVNSADDLPFRLVALHQLMCFHDLLPWKHLLN